MVPLLTDKNCRRGSSETHRVVRPNDGGRTISDNWQAQREIRTPRLLEASMLAKEHAPRNSHGQREWRRKQFMPTARADKGLKQKKKVDASRKYPRYEMHSAHHQKRCEAQALHLHPDSQ